jgi:hypothetical protein
VWGGVLQHSIFSVLIEIQGILCEPIVDNMFHDVPRPENFYFIFVTRDTAD